MDILIVVGSLRAESYNRRVAEALTKLPAGAGHNFAFADIAGLPLYNQDDDKTPSPATTALKAAVRKAGLILFVTPEYNRSIPACSRTRSTTPAGPMATAPGRGSRRR